MIAFQFHNFHAYCFVLFVTRNRLDPGGGALHTMPTPHRGQWLSDGRPLRSLGGSTHTSTTHNPRRGLLSILPALAAV